MGRDSRRVPPTSALRESRPRRPAPAATTPGVTPPGAGPLVSVLAGLVAVAFLVRIGLQAAGAKFYTDECFHAHVAQWIAQHHRLPAVMPELYSGFYYYYPPLLHLLGAFWIGLLGLASLPLLNVGLTALALLLLAFGLPPRAPGRAGIWALLLCLSSTALGTHAVRFYVEALLALFTLAATLLLLRFWRTGHVRDAALLGVSAGLALLTKQTALLMLPALAAFALFEAARRRWPRALGFGVALGVALLLSLPIFLRNLRLFGDPIYPVLSPDVDHALFEMNAHHFAIAAPEFHRQSLAAAGPLVVAAGALALGLAAARRQVRLETVLLLAIVLAAAAAPRVPLADPRHLFPLLPPFALLSAGTISAAIGARRAIATTVSLALLAGASLAVARMPDYRSGLDVPPWLAEAYAAIRREVPDDGTVLSLWTYDTFYYSGRSATWPVAWGQRVRYTSLFHKTSATRFLAQIDSAGIGYLLVPRWRPSEGFDGVNYPRRFIDCVDSLGHARQMKTLWASDWLMLVARVPPP